MNTKTRQRLAAAGISSMLVLGGVAALAPMMPVHAAVSYDAVFDATNAKDTVTQATTDERPFALYGIAGAAVLMIAYSWFKRITRSVAHGKVK